MSLVRLATEGDARAFLAERIYPDVILEQDWTKAKALNWVSTLLDEEVMEEDREIADARESFLKNYRILTSGDRPGPVPGYDTGQAKIQGYGGDSELVVLTELERLRAIATSLALANAAQLEGFVIDHVRLAAKVQAQHGSPDIEEKFAAYTETVVQQLCLRYPWEPTEAKDFLLTGRIPYTDPILVTIAARDQSHFNDGRIQITAAPWVSAESVAETFRNMRTWMIGKDAKPLSEKGLEVFKFVTLNPPTGNAWVEVGERWNSKMEGLIARLPEGHLSEEENKVCRKWIYGQPVSIHRAYEEVKRRLLRAKYRLVADPQDRGDGWVRWRFRGVRPPELDHYRSVETG